MGAGILPVAYHNNKYYFLFLKEYQKKNKNTLIGVILGAGKKTMKQLKRLP